MIFKKISVAAIISFFITLSTCSVLIVVTIQNKNRIEKLDMEGLILEKSIDINETISKLLYKTLALSALVVQSDGEIKDFERIAATIVDDPAILNVIIAPSGIVSHVYPLQGNENVLGFNLLNTDSPGNKEAIIAKDSGQLVFGGPFNLVQGGQALVGRLPVFIDTPQEGKKFWGLVSVTLKYPQALDGAELSILEKQGFFYQIWRINPDDNEKQIIASNSHYDNEHIHFIEKQISILNADWYFRIFTVRTWYQYNDIRIFAFIGLVVSFLVAFVTQSYFRLKLIRSELEIKITESAVLTEELNKEKNRADLANSAKSSFLANMSHEIRTPMSAVIGFAGLALDSHNVSPKVKDCLKKIKDSAEGLLVIIDDILDISKIESGKMKLEIIPFNINETLALCCAISNVKSIDKGIAVSFDIEPVVPKILGDPTKLRQVLLNLLSNAIKFTSEGTVTLKTTIKKASEDNITIKFEIKDNGIGMSAEQIKKIFDPFIQADNSTTRKYGGTGLGLTIAKNMVELMGGEINVESIEGLGSVFSFTLTFETADEIADNFDKTETPVSETERLCFAGDVLVCEDNVLNQQVILEHLTKIGLNVSVAPNGKVGVEMAQDRMVKGNPFHIIFMDIQMPVMDGLQAAKKLIDIGNKTPVIALTANIMPKDLEVYRQHNMPVCLGKPFNAQTLWKCLQEYLTPVSTSAAINKEIGIEQCNGNEKLYGRVIEYFVKNNENVLTKFYDAIDAKDIRLALLTIHSLGGSADIIGAVQLSSAASAIENLLSDVEISDLPYIKPFDEKMQLLEYEVNRVFDELKMFDIEKEKVNTYSASVVDRDKVIDLIHKLAPLLKSGNSKSLEFLDEIKEVFWPASDKYRLFISQMESYDFETAWETMETIRKFMKC